MLSKQVSDEVEGVKYKVVSPFDITMTHRVYFSAWENGYARTPHEAIRKGAEEVAELMGWYAAQPTNDTIHFHRAAGGRNWADVVFEEKPVPMDYQVHAPGMSDDA